MKLLFSRFVRPRPQPARSASAIQLSLFHEKTDKAQTSFAGLAASRCPSLKVQISRRLTRAWRVEWHTSGGRLTVPAVAVYAPRRVKAALLDWAMLMKLKKRQWTSSQKKQRAALETDICQFFLHPENYWTQPSKGEGELALSVFQRYMKSRSGRLAKIQPQGQHHNLNLILKKIMADYFKESLDVRITWSPRIGGMSSHCLETDGCGSSYHLITISRCYDFPDVTEEILGGVVYHELLHGVLPPYNKNGRRMVHHREFRERERAYGGFSKWQNWHKTQLPRKLAILRRRFRQKKNL